MFVVTLQFLTIILGPLHFPSDDPMPSTVREHYVESYRLYNHLSQDTESVMKSIIEIQVRPDSFFKFDAYRQPLRDCGKEILPFTSRHKLVGIGIARLNYRKIEVGKYFKLFFFQPVFSVQKVAFEGNCWKSWTNL